MRLSIICTILAFSSLPPARADFTTGNLLSNPGAELGSIVGWTPSGSVAPGVDSGSFDPGINPHTGKYDFYGVNGPLNMLTQTVTLVGTQGITAALIDSGTSFANVSFWEQGLNQGTLSDSASITLSFLNASGTVVGTVTTPVIDSHNLSWQNFSGSYAITAGTRSISYTMNFIRNVGSDNDSFIDDNSLIVTAASVPEPSSLVMLGIGSLAFSLYTIRARSRSHQLL